MSAAQQFQVVLNVETTRAMTLAEIKIDIDFPYGNLSIRQVTQDNPTQFKAEMTATINTLDGVEQEMVAAAVQDWIDDMTLENGISKITLVSLQEI